MAQVVAIDQAGDARRAVRAVWGPMLSGWLLARAVRELSEQLDKALALSPVHVERGALVEGVSAGELDAVVMTVGGVPSGVGMIECKPHGESFCLVLAGRDLALWRDEFTRAWRAIAQARGAHRLVCFGRPGWQAHCAPTGFEVAGLIYRGQA
jgi:hypothetical protein